MIEKVYLIHAAAQSGKNTCADCIKEYYESRYKKKVLIIAFADYVKFVLDKYYNTPFERTEEYRSRIQNFATDQCRKIDTNIWADTVVRLLNVITNDYDIVIIPDWRFKNEYDQLSYLNSNPDIIKIKITRPNNESTDNMTEEQREHSSERNLDNFKKFDYNICNETSMLNKTYQQIMDMIDEVEND